MKNKIILDVFKSVYDLEERKDIFKNEDFKYTFCNIKDNYFICFLEEMITKNNIYSFLNYMEDSIVDNYDANIIIVSDTNELFKKSECLFWNGDNLNVDFIFHNLNDNSYTCCMDRFGNPFYKILKPIKKDFGVKFN